MCPVAIASSSKPEDVSRKAVVAEARSWIGTPYLHLQRQKGRFTDCVGLVIGIGRTFGFGDYRKHDYLAIPDPVHMEAGLRTNMDAISPETALPGDVLWFAFIHPATKEKIPRHLGIVADSPYAGEKNIIHAWCEAGRVVEHRLDIRWRRRIHGAFRYRGIGE